MSLLEFLGEPNPKGYRERIFERPGRRTVRVEIHCATEGYKGSIFQGDYLLCIADRETLEETAKALEEGLLLSCSWVRDILYPVIGKPALERLLNEELF